MIPSSSPTLYLTLLITADLTEAALAGEVALLDADERQRSSRLVFAEDRRDFVASHALLRRILSSLDGRPPASWAFTKAARGKPRLADDRDAASLAFNISHTRGLVACLAARGALDLGVDVERIDPGIEHVALAHRVFAETEQQDVHACADAIRPERFCNLWTLKEAFVKATGTGIGGNLREFAFGFPDPPHLDFSPPPSENARDWDFALLALGDYRIAVAARHPSEDRASLVVSTVTPSAADVRVVRVSPRLHVRVG